MKYHKLNKEKENFEHCDKHLLLKWEIYFPIPKRISHYGEVSLLDSERFYSTQVNNQRQKIFFT